MQMLRQLIRRIGILRYVVRNGWIPAFEAV